MTKTTTRRCYICDLLITNPNDIRSDAKQLFRHQTCGLLTNDGGN